MMIWGDKQLWLSSVKPMQIVLCSLLFAAYCVFSPLCFGDAATAVHGGVDDAHVERPSGNQGEMLPKRHHHGGRNSQFTLAGRQVHFDSSRDFPKLVDQNGLALHYFGRTEVIRDSVTSDSGTCLLLLVDTEISLGQLPGFGYHYNYLLRLLAEPGGKIQVNRVMDASLPPMNVLHRNVLKLGGVSDDGKTALLKFGEANQEANPYSMSFSWQHWDLLVPKLLRVGHDPDVEEEQP